MSGATCIRWAHIFHRENNSWANNSNTLPTFSTRSALVNSWRTTSAERVLNVHSSNSESYRNSCHKINMVVYGRGNGLHKHRHRELVVPFILKRVFSIMAISPSAGSSDFWCDRQHLFWDALIGLLYHSNCRMNFFIVDSIHNRIACEAHIIPLQELLWKRGTTY